MRSKAAFSLRSLGVFGLFSFGLSRNLCSKSEFMCNSFLCISLNVICDGKFDCDDGSDEDERLCTDANCSQESENLKSFTDLFDFPLNLPEPFRCRYGACIPGLLKCDGISNCVDGSDETAELCSMKRCSSKQFKCAYGACIRKNKKCNGHVSCIDGSDETLELCNNFRRRCRRNHFRCDYGACVYKSRKCNGKIDCADGSDESVALCGPQHSFQQLHSAILPTKDAFSITPTFISLSTTQSSISTPSTTTSLSSAFSSFSTLHIGQGILISPTIISSSTYSISSASTITLNTTVSSTKFHSTSTTPTTLLTAPSSTYAKSTSTVIPNICSHTPKIPPTSLSPTSSIISSLPLQVSIPTPITSDSTMITPSIVLPDPNADISTTISATSAMITPSSVLPDSDASLAPSTLLSTSTSLSPEKNVCSMEVTEGVNVEILSCGTTFPFMNIDREFLRSNSPACDKGGTVPQETVAYVDCWGKSRRVVTCKADGKWYSKGKPKDLEGENTLCQSARINSKECGRLASVRKNGSRHFSWPFLVALVTGGTQICTGTLITSQWVLTAAQCVHRFSAEASDRKSLSVGPLTIQHSLPQHLNINYDVSDTFIHPNYPSSSNFGPDLALLRLKTPFILGETLVPACLTWEEVWVAPLAVTFYRGNSIKLKWKLLTQALDRNCFQREGSCSTHPHLTDNQFCGKNLFSSPDILERSTAFTGTPSLLNTKMYGKERLAVAGVLSYIHNKSGCESRVVFSSVSKHQRWIQNCIYNNRCSL